MQQTKIANTKSAILAFYPHPKAIGIAIMDSPTSVQKSGCRYLSAKKDTETYLKFIRSIIKLYGPALVILEEEKSRNQNRGKHMQYIFREIETMVTQLSSQIVHYSRKNIQEHFGQITKREVACEITKQFPVYMDRLPKERVSTDGAESPAMSEFDSLSLCITHYAQN